MPRSALLASTVTGALSAAIVPVVSFVALAPAEYGRFSVPYLVYAFGLSLQLSVVSDVWVRARASGAAPPWRDYFSTLVALCAGVAVLATVVLLAVPDLRATWWAGAAVLVAGVRAGWRYHAVADGRPARAAGSDLAAIAAFTATAVLAWSLVGPLELMLLAWLAFSLAGMAGLRTPSAIRWSSIRSWFAANVRHVRPLLAESLLMDAGAVGTPLALGPFLGFADLGVYRGVSNVALPARLALDPLRPAAGGRLGALAVTARGGLVVAAGALALGFACVAVLAWVVPAIDADLGTLGALAEFALACGVFVTAGFVSQAYYMTCRARTASRELIGWRIAQTVAAVSLPVLGYVVGGLPGAIWGYVIATAAGAAIWVVVAVRTVGRRRTS